MRRKQKKVKQMSEDNVKPESEEEAGEEEENPLEDRLAVLEKNQSQILDALKQIATVKQPEPQIQPQKTSMDLTQLLPLLLKNDSNPMDMFFKDLGERVFTNMVDKIIPSRKEMRKEVNPNVHIH